MSDYPEIKEYFEKATPDILDDLAKLVSIKSRSVERKSCEEALDFVLGRADELGFETRKGKYGDVGTVTYGDGNETLGILVHVDVVPEGDREKWNTDPFELVLKDGHLYGRGVVDDKGPVIASLYAMKYLKDSGIRPGKKIMLIVGTREEIVWEDMDHFKEEFPLPDYGFSPDGAFPIYNRENGYMDVELIFTEPLLKGDEDIRGGSATNSIPAEASAIINGELLRYKGKNAHSSVPEMGVNAIALMCEELAEKTGYGFAKLSQAARAELARIIREYILASPELVLLFVLVDSRHDIGKIDLDFIRDLGENGVPFAIIFTKGDKQGPNVLAAQVEKDRQILLEEWEELPPMFVSSAQTGAGKEDILSYIENVLANL